MTSESWKVLLSTRHRTLPKYIFVRQSFAVELEENNGYVHKAMTFTRWIFEEQEDHGRKFPRLIISILFLSLTPQNNLTMTPLTANEACQIW